MPPSRNSGGRYEKPSVSNSPLSLASAVAFISNTIITPLPIVKHCLYIKLNELKSNFVQNSV